METCFLCIYIYHPSCRVQKTRCFGKMDWLSHFLCTELAMFFFFRATTLHTCPKKFGNLQLYILVECKDKVLLKISAIWLWEYYSIQSAECNSLNLQEGWAVFRCRNQIIASNKLGLKQKVHYNNMCPFFTMWFHWILSEFFEFFKFVSLFSLSDLIRFWVNFLNFWPLLLCDFTEFWVNFLNLWSFLLCDFTGFWVNFFNLWSFLLCDFTGFWVNFFYLRPFLLCDFTGFWVNFLILFFPLCDFIEFWVNFKIWLNKDNEFSDPLNCIHIL